MESAEINAGAIFKGSSFAGTSPDDSASCSDLIAQKTLAKPRIQTIVGKQLLLVFFSACFDLYKKALRHCLLNVVHWGSFLKLACTCHIDHMWNFSQYHLRKAYQLIVAFAFATAMTSPRNVDILHIVPRFFSFQMIFFDRTIMHS